MLPDLPSLKNDIQWLLTRYLRNQINARLGVFNEAPKHKAFEGNRMRVMRADGTVTDSEYKESSAELSVSLGEVPKLSIEDRLLRINNIADEMAGQMSKHLFETLTKAIDSVGNVVDRKGKPFDAETVFEAFNTVQIEFDEAGNHNMSWVMHPNLIEKAKKVFEQIDSDPVLKRRFDEMMERKRVEWRDREASRKLVG
jgi:hypothetical protein